MPSPAFAHNMENQKKDQIHCDKASFLALTGDKWVEDPKVAMYDDKGNLLAAEAKAAVVANAELVVCVKLLVGIKVDVNIFVKAALDTNGDGKKDTIVVAVDVKADVDVQIELKAKIVGQVNLSASVVAEVNAKVALKGGEKKRYKCKGKDGYDSN